MKIKPIASALAICLLIAILLGGNAPRADSAASLPREHQALLLGYLEAVSRQDWRGRNELMDGFCQTEFPQEYEQNRWGLLSVDSMSLIEIKAIPLEKAHLAHGYLHNPNEASYTDIAAYYMGLNVRVCEETDFWKNGPEYDILLLGRNAHGQWKILAYEIIYDFPLMRDLALAFDSPQEKAAERIWSPRP